MGQVKHTTQVLSDTLVFSINIDIVMDIKKLSRNIFQFYLTLLIPLLYFLILGVIITTPNNFPMFLLPMVLILGRPSGRYGSMVLAGIGLILWITSYFFLGKEFGVLPHKPQKVVKTGPYKYLHHPMYVGIFLTFTGLSLANLSSPGFLLNLLILTPLNWYRAINQSKNLK